MNNIYLPFLLKYYEVKNNILSNKDNTKKIYINTISDLSKSIEASQSGNLDKIKSKLGNLFITVINYFYSTNYFSDIQLEKLILDTKPKQLIAEELKPRDLEMTGDHKYIYLNNIAYLQIMIVYGSILKDINKLYYNDFKNKNELAEEIIVSIKSIALLFDIPIKEIWMDIINNNIKIKNLNKN